MVSTMQPSPRRIVVITYILRPPPANDRLKILDDAPLTWGVSSGHSRRRRAGYSDRRRDGELYGGPTDPYPQPSRMLRPQHVREGTLSLTSARR
jgi:hypothetical protein